MSVDRRTLLKGAAVATGGVVTAGVFGTRPADADEPDGLVFPGVVEAADEHWVTVRTPDHGTVKITIDESSIVYAGISGRTDSTGSFEVGDKVLASGCKSLGGGSYVAATLGSYYTDLSVAVRGWNSSKQVDTAKGPVDWSVTPVMGADSLPTPLADPGRNLGQVSALVWRDPKPGVLRVVRWAEG